MHPSPTPHLDVIKNAEQNIRRAVPLAAAALLDMAAFAADDASGSRCAALARKKSLDGAISRNCTKLAREFFKPETLAEVATMVSDIAGRPVGVYADAGFDFTHRVWFWPAEIEDADDQAKAAVGVWCAGTECQLVDGDLARLDFVGHVTAALDFIGRRMSVGAAPVDEVAEIVSPAAPAAALIKAAEDTHAAAKVAHTMTLKAYDDSGAGGWDLTACTQKEARARESQAADLWALHDVTQAPLLAAQAIVGVTKDLSIGKLTAAMLAAGRTLLPHHDSTRFASLAEAEIVRDALVEFADVCADEAKSDRVPAALIDMGGLLRAQASAAGVSAVKKVGQHSDSYVAASVAGWIADYLSAVGAPGPDGGERVPNVVADEAVPVIAPVQVIAPSADLKTEHNGLPVFVSKADLKAFAGGFKQEFQGFSGGGWMYERFSGPKGGAWLAKSTTGWVPAVTVAAPKTPAVRRQKYRCSIEQAHENGRLGIETALQWQRDNPRPPTRGFQVAA